MPAQTFDHARAFVFREHPSESSVAAWEMLADGLTEALRDASPAREEPTRLDVRRVDARKHETVISEAKAAERRRRAQPTVEVTPAARARVRLKLKAKSPPRWPLALCILIASASAGAAFMTSPLGQRPETLRIITIARTQVIEGVHAATALVQR